MSLEEEVLNSVKTQCGENLDDAGIQMIFSRFSSEAVLSDCLNETVNICLLLKTYLNNGREEEYKKKTKCS